jgi:hypothetical protein
VNEQAPKGRGGPFADLLKSRDGKLLRKPGRVVELPLTGWADEQADKPSSPIPIGIRLPSEDDIQRARDEALKAIDTFASRGDADDRIAAYNDALIRELVASCTCQSVDVTVGFFELGALDVRRRLTTSGVQRLYQEIDALITSSDASIPELDDEGFSHLAVLWDRQIGLEHLPAEERRKVRRLLELCRQTLAEGEERAARAGVAIIGREPERDEAPAEMAPELASAFAAMQRRQAPDRTGTARK